MQYHDDIVFDNDKPFSHMFMTMTDEQIRDWVANLEEFQLRYHNIMVNFPGDEERDVSCYCWNVNQRFYHLEAAQIRVELDTDPSTCPNVTTAADFWWLNAMTICFAVISFFLDLNNILETLSIIRKLRHRFTQD